MTLTLKRPKHTSPNLLQIGDSHEQRIGRNTHTHERPINRQHLKHHVYRDYPRSIVGAEMRHIEALHRECLQYQYEMRTRRDLRLIALSLCTIQKLGE